MVGSVTEMTPNRHIRVTPPSHPHLMKRAGLTVAFLMVTAGMAAPQESSAPADPTETRNLVGRWIGTQQMIARERKEWQQGKEILQSRIELLRKEISDLDTQVGEARRAAGDSDSRQAEAIGAIELLKGDAALLERTVLEFEVGVRDLARRVPEPLRQKVDPLLRRMPEAGVPTRVSMAERFQNILGILNELNRMNGEITLATEVRALSDGRPSEVKTVYIGLGQAYFISARGEAGIGRPGSDGWTWDPAPEVAPQIAAAIEILENKSSPEFVPLPVRIQ